MLRRTPQTVDDLAAPLDLTDNAVRAHLTSLERDGLVRQSGVRRGPGKPAHVYTLTAEAQRLFSKAYAPVLGALLDVLGDQLDPENVGRLIEQTGQHLGREHSGVPDADRLAAAIGVLEGLGGVIRVEHTETSTLLHGGACPLAALLPEHPEVCRLAESLLSTIVGAPVVERCERDEPPRCRFELAHPDAEPA